MIDAWAPRDLTHRDTLDIARFWTLILQEARARESRMPRGDVIRSLADIVLYRHDDSDVISRRYIMHCSLRAAREVGTSLSNVHRLAADVGFAEGLQDGSSGVEGDVSSAVLPTVLADVLGELRLGAWLSRLMAGRMARYPELTLFNTDTGLLGYGYRGVRPGSMVVVLEAATLPMIVEESKDVSSPAVYKIVGPAIVEEVMTADRSGMKSEEYVFA